MIRFRYWFLFVWANPLTFAGIELETTPTDVYIRGHCQKVNGISFTSNHNDVIYSEIYMRIRLSNAVKLCKTLVWQHPSNQGNPTFTPIYVPMALLGLPGDTLAAPADTLTIVRWKKGEPELWLRFATESDAWVQTAAGDLVAPSPDRIVFWRIGLSARSSYETFSPYFSAGTANLAAATRDPQQIGMETAVSTNLCLDASNSNLAVGAPPSDQTDQVVYDPILFYYPTLGGVIGTALTHLGIPQGQSVPYSMYGDTVLGNSIDVTCSGSAVTENQSSVGLNPLYPDLIQLTNRLRFQVGCGQSWGIHTNSEIHLQAPPEGIVGFVVALDGDGNPVDYHTVDASVPPGTAVLLENDVFLIGDPGAPPRAPAGSLFPVGEEVWLAQTAIVRFEGAGQVSDRLFEVEASASADRRVTVPPIEVGVSIVATNRDSVLDQPPFDGPEQEILCGPDRVEAFILNWAFGTPPATVPTLDTAGLLLLSALLLGFTLSMSRRTASLYRKP